MSGLVRILLTACVALAAFSSPARATMLWKGGSGVVANTCSAGDFFSAVDGSGNFTCSTPSGSGDVTAVGDCASGACFASGGTGTALFFQNATSGSVTLQTVAGALGTRTVSLPAASGTVALERVYDVRAYGAACDDSTNDTSAIQAAIDAAEAARGGIVMLPANRCIVTGLTIDAPGVTLQGQGRGASSKPTVLSCNITTGTCLTFGSSCTSGCGVEGMIISTRSAPTDAVLVDGSSASGTFARDINFVGSRYCTGLKNISSIDGVSMFEPVAGVSCRGISIVDAGVFINDVKGNWSTDIEAMIAIEQTGTNLVDTVQMSKVEIATSGGAGAALKIIGASTTNPPRWVRISDSFFEAKTTGASAGDYGIYIDNVRDFECSNCYSQGGYRSVQIDGGPGPIVFNGGSFGNTQREAVYHDADVPTMFIGSLISDASLSTSNTYSDVYLSTNSRGFVMIGGVLGGDYMPGFSGATSKYGIEAAAGADEYRLSNVRCDGPVTACASGLSTSAAQAAFTDGTAYADSDWSNYVLVRAPTLSANWTLTLPADDGSANQFLQTDGNGTTTWATPDHGALGGLSDDDHTQYFLLAGRTLSDPAASTTVIAQQTTASPLAMTNGSGFKWLNWDADLTVPNISLSQIFSVNGSLDRTGTTDSLYQFTGFHMATEFTSSTANGPLFQDAFFDASVVNQVANTGTQNTYQPISFLSKPTFKASSGATLTIGQTTGVDINPSWGVAAGGTLTNTTFSAFKLHSPNEIGGTLSLPTYIALDVEDLDTAAVTTPLSLRSVGTTTEMRHAGPARFGATGAVTATYDLDVQGAANLDGDVRVGASQGAVSADDSIVTFPYDHDFSGVAADMEILKINPTVHIGQASALLGTYSGVSSKGMTIAHDDSTTAVGNLPAVQLFYGNHVVDNSVAVASPNTFTFFDQANVRGSGGVTVPSGGTQGHQSVRATPFFSAINASTAFTQLAGVGLYWAPTVGTDNGADDGASVTVTTMTGVSIQDTANAGGAGTEAVTTQIGVDIAALSFGGTNIGIRNADTTVYTPTTQAITAAGNTILPTATTVCLTANSNYDMTSNPQIADGVEGQILYLWNCDSSTETIELNDTNGLQLTALFNMDAGDVIVLQYMNIAGAADWYEVSRTED